MITVLLAAMLVQNPSDLDAALDALAAVKPGEGAAYVAARDKILAFGAKAIPGLAERGAADRWTEAGWVRALAAEACRLRLASPDLAASVDRPDGLDPATYRQFRKPEPILLPFLARLGPDAVPLLLERWRWTFEIRPYSEGEAGGKERDALRSAILAMPGRVGDARARPFLAEILASTAARDAWRQDAAVSLGLVGGTAALPKLTAPLDDATQPAAVREACARALGRIADPSALAAIRLRLPAEKDPQVRRSYLHGLGILGSAWAWEARGKDAAAFSDSVRGGCAETLVEALKKYPSEAETIGLALGIIRLPSSLAAVEALAADASAPADARAAATAILPALRQAVSRKR